MRRAWGRQRTCLLLWQTLLCVLQSAQIYAGLPLKHIEDQQRLFRKDKGRIRMLGALCADNTFGRGNRHGLAQHLCVATLTGVKLWCPACITEHRQLKPHQRRNRTGGFLQAFHQPNQRGEDAPHRLSLLENFSTQLQGIHRFGCRLQTLTKLWKAVHQFHFFQTPHRQSPRPYPHFQPASQFEATCKTFLAAPGLHCKCGNFPMATRQQFNDSIGLRKISAQANNSIVYSSLHTARLPKESRRRIHSRTEIKASESVAEFVRAVGSATRLR